MTSNLMASIAPPPEYDVRRRRDWSPSRVLDEHGRRLGEVADMVVPIAKGAVMAEQTAREVRSLEFQVNRGALVPMTERELRLLLRRAEGGATAPEPPVVRRLRAFERAAYLGLFAIFLLDLIRPSDGSSRQLLARLLVLLLLWAVAVGLSMARWLLARRHRRRMPS